MSDAGGIKQGSEAWFKLRMGKVTASRIADMLAQTKSGWGAGRREYMVELANEMLTQKPHTGGYKSAEMTAGTEAEPEARKAYEFAYGVTVVECGFVPHPTIGQSGASPDGLVGDDGVVEIKCPIMTTHQETLLGGTIPRKYELQRQWQLACTGRKWCDYISYLDKTRYHPDEYEEFDRRGMRLCVRRTWRDSAKIAEIEREVVTFLKEVNERYRELDRRFPAPDATPEIRPDNVLMGG